MAAKKIVKQTTGRRVPVKELPRRVAGKKKLIEGLHRKSVARDQATEPPSLSLQRRKVLAKLGRDAGKTSSPKLPIPDAPMLESIIDMRSAQEMWRYMVTRNPDKIVSQKGRGRIDFYYEMTDTDGVLAGLVETRIDSVAGLSWEIVPAYDEDKASVEIAEFVDWALDSVDMFDDDIAEILSACVTGFSVAEVIWRDALWRKELRLVPKELLSRPADIFSFGPERELRLLSSKSQTEGEDTRQWPMKFIVYTFRKRNEDPYGISMLRSIYWMWWFKHHAFEYWLRAAEMGAEVTPVFRYNEYSSEEEIAEMAESAKLFLKSKY